MMEAGVVGAATQNPMLAKNIAKGAAKSAFTAIAKDDADAKSAATREAIENGADEKEIAEMSSWAQRIKIMMLLIATFMMITCYYNFANSSNSVSTNMLAFYVLFFSTLVCCYELALKQASTIIVQNFGFLYNPYGRTVFLFFVAILLFQLSTLGQVCFALLLAAGAVQIYVNCKYPKFEKYMRHLHYHKAPMTASPALEEGQQRV